MKKWTTPFLGFAVILYLCSMSSAQDTINITTYYPSPYGSYRELTAHRMKIGRTYSDSATSVADDNLIVEGNVGIGTIAPSYKLDVTGSIRATESFIMGYEKVSRNCGSDSTDCDVDCPSGKQVLGGGCTAGGYSLRKSYPKDSNTWSCTCASGQSDLVAYAICAKVQ